jgi:hypothetical protein
MGDLFELRIYKDTSKVTYGYTVFDVGKNEPVIEGDGYSSVEEVISDISHLRDAFKDALRKEHIKIQED